jgi:hypothetical protein
MVDKITQGVLIAGRRCGELPVCDSVQQIGYLTSSRPKIKHWWLLPRHNPKFSLSGLPACPDSDETTANIIAVKLCIHWDELCVFRVIRESSKQTGVVMTASRQVDSA